MTSNGDFGDQEAAQVASELGAQDIRNDSGQSKGTVNLEDRVVSGAQAFAGFATWFGTKLAISALKGFYAPLFATTALKQFKMEPAAEDARYAANDRVNAQQFFDTLSWCGGRSQGLVGHFLAAQEAFQSGNGEWYLAALAVTNAADYLRNAYSMSKNRRN